MAFSFPRRDPGQLFFPTLHVHDGQVHETAAFDHTLYCQLDAPAGPMQWERSAALATGGPIGTAGAWLDPRRHVQRLRIVGTRANEDIVAEPCAAKDQG